MLRWDETGSPVADVFTQCDCHISQKRKYKRSASLRLPEINASGTPFNIIECKLSNIARAQPIAGSQQKDRVISAAKGG
jgi:hypothetical protein